MIDSGVVPAAHLARRVAYISPGQGRVLSSDPLVIQPIDNEMALGEVVRHPSCAADQPVARRRPGPRGRMSGRADATPSTDHASPTGPAKPQLNACAPSFGHPHPPADEPGWLPDTFQTVASPDILLLRDGYGLRFGLLIEMTGPNRPTRTYLMDVDLCHNFDQVLACGYYPDVQTAATAWRAWPVPARRAARPHRHPPSYSP
jgi:hypothetical protein